VKPTRQPWEKQTSFKNKIASACCLALKHNKNLIYFIYQQKKCSTKCKIEKNDSINEEQYKTFTFTIQLNENSIKRHFHTEIFFCLFCSFRVQNADAKQKKRKKKPNQKPRNSLICVNHTIGKCHRYEIINMDPHQGFAQSPDFSMSPSCEQTIWGHVWLPLYTASFVYIYLCIRLCIKCYAHKLKCQ
jgi:hypothetical protein